MAIYGLLLGFYLPIDIQGRHFFDCLFSVTTTSGGDTGAHHYPAQYLIQELLPNWKLTGWAPGWYAGMPMLTFYFPFPFLIIAILSTVIPYEVAFKLGTVLGVFLLPLTAYAFGRLLRIRKPYPILAAVFATGFLFMEKAGSGLYSIYGGNILSTLAGEFGYMLSFALVALFLGTLFRGMEKPRVNMLFVANCLLLMALTLSHVVTTIVLVFIVWGLLLPFLFKVKDEGWSAVWKPAVYVVAVGFVGFCLTAFWSLPFVANMDYTAGMEWYQLEVLGRPVPLGTQIVLTIIGAVGLVTSVSLGVYAAATKRRVLPLVATAVAVTATILGLIMVFYLSSNLIPRTWQFLTVFVLGIVGMAYAVAKRERRLLPLAWVTVVAFLMYALMPDGKALWNGRLLSFWYFSFHLWAAYALTWFVRGFMTIMWDLLRIRTRHTRPLYIPLLAVVAIAVIGASSTVAGGWIQWNYLGYEKKAAWPEYREMLDYMETLPPNSRVMWEHGDAINDFGTPRAFELIPYWTQSDTMEGTLMEASYTAPFHFINQRELSEQSSNAIIGVEYPPGVDTQMGITHLQFMNIPYLLAFENQESEELVIPGVEADPRAELLETFGVFKFYHIKDCSDYVQIMQNKPLRVNIGAGTEWRDMAVEWYKSASALDTALIRDTGDEALQQFTELMPESAAYPPQVPIETDGQVSNIVLENQKLSFDTTAIGVPHWIKISYFPNWHVKGAEGPYLASPSFMMVIPTSEHVELYYGRTWANNVGQALEVLAWALLIGLSIWRFIVWNKRRETPVVAGPPTTELVPPPLPPLPQPLEAEEKYIPDFEDDPPLR